MTRPLELTNKRFGRLVALYSTKSVKYKRIWLCKCDCGNYIEVPAPSLSSGNTKSCGCLHKEILIKRNYRHGDCRTHLYSIYRAIIQRCYDPNYKRYQDYGGRGITVCDEWRNDYLKFKKWSINNGYKKSLSIDRINVNGSYSPENCRWIPLTKQAKNKRTNHFITYKGKTMILNDWAKETGIEPSLVLYRQKKNWPIEKVLTK